ncbi:MAG: two-component system response regulator CreB [Bdellovibrionota bacterium]
MAEHILVVEDEPSIADTIVYALTSDGFQVTAVQTCQAARDAFSSNSFALLVLDVGLPDGSGFELIKTIRQVSQVPVIFLTARSAEVDRVVGLEIGADDYVVKPFSPRELSARVKTILRRAGAALHPAASAEASNTSSTGAKSLTAVGPFTINEEKLLISFSGAPLELSRYEYRILVIFLRSPGRVYSREQLMQLAWEEPEMSLDRTVDAHIKSLRAKIRAVSKDADPIVTHRGFGYSLRDYP